MPSHTFSKHIARVLVPGLALAGLTLASPAAADDHVEVVHFCGQKVLGRAKLVANLDCTRHEDLDSRVGVRIGRHGKLDLNGFSILRYRGRAGVRCLGTCKISNGTIHTTQRGVAGVLGRKKTTLNNVVISGGWTAGVLSRQGVIMRDSEVHGAGDVGVESERRSVRVRGSMISDIGRRRTGLGTAVRAGRDATVIESSISGNRQFGVATPDGRTVIEDSMVTGNGIDEGCNVERACADLHSRFKPGVVLSECWTSDRRWEDGQSGDLPSTDWNVCSAD